MASLIDFSTLESREERLVISSAVKKMQLGDDGGQQGVKISISCSCAVSVTTRNFPFRNFIGMILPSESKREAHFG